MVKPIRVAIAHAPTLIAESLVGTLSGYDQLELLPGAEAPRARGRAGAPDVVLLGLDAPGRVGELVADVREDLPGTHVLVLARPEVGAAAEVMRAGAHGYLDYNCGLQELVRAIERVSLGDIVVMASPPAADAAVFADEPSPPTGAAGFGSLTERERDVLRLVAEGRTNAEIADELCITNHTVKGHLAKILGKLMLHNRVQLATYAMQNGLAQPSSDAGSAGGSAAREG